MVLEKIPTMNYLTGTYEGTARSDPPLLSSYFGH
ncbi:unnamed protein product, partial [Rotaria magnacalcarata]